MYYLSQAILVWIAAIWVIEWRRLRELFVYALMGGYMALFQDTIGDLTGLWQYDDGWLLNGHREISILISISAAPLFAMYFVQGLKHSSPWPWKRILAITAVAMIPETVGLYTGNIFHYKWWNWGASVIAYILLWTVFWGLHRWLSRKG